MIKDVPKVVGLKNSGKELLDLAWRMVVDILRMTNEDFYDGLTTAQKNAFWKNARREFLTAHTLVVQGIELIIKSKIAAVSPFLLLENISRTEDNEPFSKCKTIQESSLITYFNKISDKPISSTFSKRFSKMLDLRNEIIHLETAEYKNVAGIKELAAKILVDVMDTSRILLGERWLDVREKYLETSVSIFGDDGLNVRGLLCNEYKAAYEALSKKQVGSCFHHNKTAKKYYCVNCFVASGAKQAWEFEEFKFAVIDPKDNSKVYCPVCDSHYDFSKYKCVTNYCRGAIHSVGFCLCCLDEN